jgi:hypothetical protein
MERPPVPEGIDLSADRRASIVATSVVTWLLAVVVIILRLLSRRMKGVELWLDDWFIIAALVSLGHLSFQWDSVSDQIPRCRCHHALKSSAWQVTVR